jgi:hypothetical protein
MKLTQEFKKAFAAQYFTQKVAKVDGVKELQEVRRALWHELDNGVEFHIQLKPIESITDEQAMELGYDTKEQAIRIALFNPIHSIDADLLRLWGYAVPFRSVSVETMIEEGILKLEK